MALVERGKGRKRRSFEVVRLGSVLRSQEVDSGDARLPGFRRFTSDEAAQAGLIAEIRGHLRDGMQPADDEARAIAAAQPAPGAGGPQLPLRADLAIYNEATGFVVTSRRMAGKPLEEGSAAWKRAVSNGDMIPVAVVQDDPFVIRIVVGGPLSDQENAEWVSRIDAHLNVADGKLCVTGGAVFTNEDYDPDDDYGEQFVGEVAIPKGRYKATLYGQYHGVNGASAIDELAGGYDKGEPAEQWYARTRPGTAPPDWENQELVDFLLHLEPVEAAPKSGLTPLPREGWFGDAENARKPELCPLGLVARDVQRRVDPESGTWTYVRDVSESLGKFEPVNLQGGGPVALPAKSLAAAARLGWLGSRLAAHELRITLPKGSLVDLSGSWPEGVVAVEESGAVRILFSADLAPGDDIARLTEATPRIADMPDGSILEARSAPMEDFPGTRPDAGKLILRGALNGGTWKIARAYPAIAAGTLESALKLARELNEGATISVKDAAEGKSIVEAARHSIGAHLKANPPEVAGNVIRFKQPGREVALVGIVAYQQRFGNAATGASQDADADEGDDEDDDGMFPTEPIKGALLFVSPGGKSFHQTMALLLSTKIETKVRSQEKALKQAGFKDVGDVMCAEVSDIAFHCYGRPDKLALAWFRVSYPDEAVCELISTFAGGAILLTSQDAEVKADPGAGLFVESLPQASPDGLVAAHRARLSELSATLGAPREIAAGVKAAADVVSLRVEKF